MSSENLKPIILLAFANNRQGFLHKLDQEQRDLVLALDSARELCEVIVRPDATLDDIRRVFQAHPQRVAIFHYAGHADDYHLLLQSEAGEAAQAHSAGLVAFLASQSGLQLVFLNGCSTKQQAKDLISAGVPAVVGTALPIDDALASVLAKRFYEGLASGVKLEKAWNDAVSLTHSDKGTASWRHVNYEGKETPLDFFSWDIYYREGAEKVKDWNLPDAAENPLFGLPEIPQKYYLKLPEQPFLGLEYFKQQHAAIFFGRGAQIRKLYNYVTGIHPIILFYGESGVGKSSLLDAGLLPRLENDFTVQYARRDATKGLTATLLQALQAAGAATVEPAALLEAWCDIEAKTGCSLIVVLDQAEETFTQPLKKEHAESGRELEVFLAALKSIFDQTGQRPQGKLILSYRKEYHPDIREAFQKFSLPHAGMFLQQLDRNGIIEAVEGLRRSPHTREKYHLEIEKSAQADLAGIIADDLLADQKSALAPVLQMVLTKLWLAAVQENSDAPHFTLALYQQLKNAGIAMEEFLKQQMAQLQQWNDEVVASGLALDLLHAHTTPLGTAGVCALAELQQAYSHRQEVLDPLLAKCKSLYLLTDGQQQRNASTRLAHDILAPVIMREYQNSDKPGQRAARVLSSKLPDFKIDEKNVWLDNVDLAVVEKGRKGMRQLADQEKRLLQSSQERRRRGRMSRYILMAVFLGLAVVGHWAIREVISKNETSKYSMETVEMRLLNLGYYDANWNPDGKGIDNKLELQKDDLIVFDGATKLYWQRSGSEGELSYDGAFVYVDNLKLGKFAAYDDWRLPTLEEAMSLMEPEKKNGSLHIDPMFDGTQRSIWTSSKQTAGVAWHVLFNNGGCYLNMYVDDIYFVRAVRSDHD